jgi:hypothetical protein
MSQNERQTDKRGRPASQITGFDRVDDAEEALPPEPGDLADRAQAASLDPDEGVNDVGGDQDIDTAATDADVNEQEPLEKRSRANRERPQH